MTTRRLRRLRLSPSLRAMVREHRVTREDLISPLFVCAGGNVREPLASIPGSCLLAGEALVSETLRLRDMGIPAVVLFPVIEERWKDPRAAYSVETANPLISAVRLLSRAVPELAIIVDLCLCEYTSHGHCGILESDAIANDATLEVLARASVALGQAGADIVAPSGVMDGTVATLRSALDGAGCQDVALMPYSAKFDSVLYGPFKTATRSQPAVSKHATHQLDVANGREALRKIHQDIDEGADAVIVKPAVTSLDILAAARRECLVPLAAYDVSGSYRMVMDFAGNDEGLRRAAMMEILTAIKRAGADMIITYHAPEVCRALGSTPHVASGLAQLSRTSGG